MSWDWILGVLPWLLFLACPISMWWMMRGMSHGESCGKQAKDEGVNAAAEPVDRRDEEIRLLKERLARVEADRKIMENWR